MTSSEIREYRDVVREQIQTISDENIMAGALNAGKLEMLIEIAAQLAEANVSLRDRFAMAAMQSLMASNQYAPRTDICKSAYFYADGMMEERSDRHKEMRKLGITP